MIEKSRKLPASSSLLRGEIGSLAVTALKRQVACGQTKLAYGVQKIPHFLLTEPEGRLGTCG